MKYLFLFIALLFLAGCGTASNFENLSNEVEEKYRPFDEYAKGQIIEKDPQFWQTQKFAKEDGLISYASSFEQELPWSWKGDYSIAYLDDIVITDEQARYGEKSVKFTVTKDSTIHGGTRSELIWKNFDEEGTTVWYAWSVLVPQHYQEVDLKDANGKNNWQTMGQWHDEVGPGGNGPPIAFYYGYDPQRDKRGLALEYGAPTQKTVGEIELQKGVWNDILVGIKWSTQSDGKAEIYVNNELYGSVDGANMHDERPHYFKLGLYRNPNIEVDQTVYYDGFVVGYDKVAVQNHFS